MQDPGGINLTTITLTVGADVITLQGERGARVEYQISQRSAQIGVPNRVGDVNQYLGRESTEIMISGFILPEATWPAKLTLLAGWAGNGTVVAFAFSMMPSPFASMNGTIKDIKPVVRIGEKDLVVIQAKMVEVI